MTAIPAPPLHRAQLTPAPTPATSITAIIHRNFVGEDLIVTITPTHTHVEPATNRDPKIVALDTFTHHYLAGGPHQFILVPPWLCKLLDQALPINDPTRPRYGPHHPLAARLARQAEQALIDWASPAAGNLKPLLVATDASASRRRSTVGWAAVAEHGVFHVGTASGGTIAEGELLAIVAAAKAWRRRHLVVLTDSRCAVAMAGGRRRCATSRAQSLVDELVGLADGRTIELRWVRGHSGHPMNECADRLAVASRRHKELQVDEQVAGGVLSRIVDELTPFVDVAVPVSKHRAVLGGQAVRV